VVLNSLHDLDSAFDPARYYCDDAIALSLATPTVSESPTTDPAILALLESNRAGLERFAGIMESQGARDAQPAAKLPELKPHDRQAWQLSNLHGMTQGKVAAVLNKEHGTTCTQGQVSRMIGRAKAHADASGLSEKVPSKIERPRTVDPGRLELGARVDRRKPRPSDITRANDDDE